MNQEVLKEHYYGDAIRVIFIIAGLAMIVMFPFFSSILRIPIFVPILTVIILAILSGFLNPKQIWPTVANTVVAIVACSAFQYYATSAYLHLSPNVTTNIVFFWTNQILALLFFVAIYLSVKTLRGRLVKDDGDKSQDPAIKNFTI